MYYFANDYSEGAHPNILQKLTETNFEKLLAYGHDKYSLAAKEKIKSACELGDESEVYFLVGGTQTNATVISAILRNYEGVISADTGHISVNEAGAIEHSTHKVLNISNENGKITSIALEKYMTDYNNNANKEHLVVPGMVYISFPTEYGTLYTKKELIDLKKVCDKYNLPLFIDGARLSYALASSKNDITLKDLARYSSVFYIGGTKSGALFGEAVVIPDSKLISHFCTTIKQNGALLAKSRTLGIQFDVLFTDNLYIKIAKKAVEQALKIKKTLIEKGYKLYIDSYTNQQFVVVDNIKMKELAKNISFGFMCKYNEKSSVIRFCTSWATNDEDVNNLLKLL